MEKHILIADEVAELLRVDKQRVYELVRTNRIPVIRIGDRQYRFAADAINRWLNGGGSTKDDASEESSNALKALQPSHPLKRDDAEV